MLFCKLWVSVDARERRIDLYLYFSCVAPKASGTKSFCTETELKCSRKTSFQRPVVALALDLRLGNWKLFLLIWLRNPCFDFVGKPRRITMIVLAQIDQTIQVLAQGECPLICGEFAASANHKGIHNDTKKKINIPVVQGHPCTTATQLDDLLSNIQIQRHGSFGQQWADGCCLTSDIIFPLMSSFSFLMTSYCCLGSLWPNP